MKDYIARLRTAERLINEALTTTIVAHARVRLLEARSAIILVRTQLMKLEPPA